LGSLDLLLPFEIIVVKPRYIDLTIKGHACPFFGPIHDKWCQLERNPIASHVISFDDT